MSFWEKLFGVTATESTKPNMCSQASKKLLSVDWFTSNKSASSFSIGTAPELAGFAHLANCGNTFEGKTIVLSDDIDLAGYSWKPINSFAGTFNGNGKTIKRLRVKSDASQCGLFGQVTKQGILKNLILDEVSITGKDSVGGFAAVNFGIISSCINLGGYVVSKGMEVGGIVGTNYGLIKNCSNAAEVNPLEKIAGMCYSGGIAGSNHGGQVLNCMNTGIIHGNRMIAEFGVLSNSKLGVLCKVDSLRREPMIGIVGLSVKIENNVQTGNTTNCLNVTRINNLVNSVIFSFGPFKECICLSEEDAPRVSCTLGPNFFAITKTRQQRIALLSSLNSWVKQNNSSGPGESFCEWAYDVGSDCPILCVFKGP